MLMGLHQPEVVKPEEIKKIEEYGNYMHLNNFRFCLNASRIHSKNIVNIPYF